MSSYAQSIFIYAQIRRYESSYFFLNVKQHLFAITFVYKIRNKTLNHRNSSPSGLDLTRRYLHNQSNRFRPLLLQVLDWMERFSINRLRCYDFSFRFCSGNHSKGNPHEYQQGYRMNNINMDTG